MFVSVLGLRGESDSPQRLAFLSMIAGAALVALVVVSVSRTTAFDWLNAASIAVALSLAAVTHASARRLAEKERAAMRLAEYDALSGLPNRLHFSRLLSAEIGRVRRQEGKSLALLLVDIDYFKQVNDTFGHQAGDRLITLVAERVREKLRIQDTLARLGGDEFAIIMTSIEGAQDCELVCQRLKEAMQAPFDLGDAQVTVSLSIGIAICPDHSWSTEGLIRSADVALYQVKANGRNGHAHFEPRTTDVPTLRRFGEEDLRSAIEKDRLTLVYQPIVAAQNAKLLGVEALLRWDHPRKGRLAPAAFLKSMNDPALMKMLDDWALRRACSDAAGWPRIRVAVNVSPFQFQRADFVERVLQTLEETKLDPERLELELNESCICGDALETETRILALRSRGVRFAFDQFGTGHASPLYLRRFPIDKVKLDRSLLPSHGLSAEGTKILKETIQIGRTLNLTIAAVGIETQHQRRIFQDLGAREMQGYHFAPARTVGDIAAICDNDFRLRREDGFAGVVRLHGPLDLAPAPQREAALVST